eukprot:m51a1_g11433 putative glycosyltransferase family 2 protein (1021) ;mRNA; r:3254-6946
MSDSEGEGQKQETRGKMRQRHLREEKELKARMREAQRGARDKESKARVAADNARLEEELRARHAAEAAQLQAREEQAEQQHDEAALHAAEAARDGANAKAAAAQQRRAAKLAEEQRQRDARVEAARSRGPTPAETEAEKLREKLEGRGLCVEEIAADGNCLFRAVEAQLARAGRRVAHGELRRMAAEHGAAHADEYAGFVEGGDARAHAALMRGDAQWGGHIELIALAKALEARIAVVSADAPDLVFGEGSPALTLRHAHPCTQRTQRTQHATDGAPAATTSTCKRQAAETPMQTTSSESAGRREEAGSSEVQSLASEYTEDTGPSSSSSGASSPLSSPDASDDDGEQQTPESERSLGGGGDGGPEYDAATGLREAVAPSAPEAELVGRFRTEAFQTKMRIFAFALVANVVFMLIIWMCPASLVHLLFLGYIVLGAVPKFVFGSLLTSHRPHIKCALPALPFPLDGTGRQQTESQKKAEAGGEADVERGQRTWRISVPCYICPRCGKEIMGWQFCKHCGQGITHDHPTLVTACVTVHHEDRAGLDGGVRSFETSQLPFERRYMQLIYVVDGRLDRQGRPDPLQRDTTRFLLARLYGIDEGDVGDAPDSCLSVRGHRHSVVPEDGTAVYRGSLDGMPFVVLLKRSNKGKRDSHRMFFDYMHRGITSRTAQGILFVDSDTKFSWDKNTMSLGHLYRGLVKAESNGGACGEIEVAEWGTNALTLMQYFEYKSNQFLAKTAESWFGMVTCLPGAFCIIRPQALEQVLNDYLADSKDIWQKNQLDLGEDRTLTTLLLKNGWDTVYCQKAVAVTKVPDSITGLVKQRRRWINSTIVNMARSCSHTRSLSAGLAQMVLLRCVKRVAAAPLLVSLALELISSFTLPTAVLMLFVEIFAGMNLYRPFVVGLVVMWCIALMMFSLTAELERAVGAFRASTVVGAFMIAMMLVQLVQQLGSFWHRAWLEVVVIAGWMLIVAAAAVVHGQWKAVFSVVAPLAWLFLSPMMYVIVPIYAICNFDDVSWGTRGA